jgi:prepilin-type N-terminal cleavage/methylation domain-containing protein/prepilin-type processing-associated H-X9-DG protein
MTPKTRMKRSRPERTGFTLIELLVVISIIALLLSLLLPSMTGARRTGQRVSCAAGLRHISEGMQQYAQDNDDAIVGGPETSGAYMYDPVTASWSAQAWGPAVQAWDFMGPMAQIWNMGLTVPSKGDSPDVVAKRFNELRAHPAFLCAANKFLAMWFGGPQAGAGWMVSYNTQRYQLWSEGSWPSTHGEKPPPNWKPVTTRIGVPADKIYAADGARYSTGDTAPDYDLSVEGAFGGAFSDTGSYSTFSKSWDRSWAPGNNKVGTVDARYYAFRHATAEPPTGAPANVFRGNFAFYDGHVEGQGDLQSANPYQWLPAGSSLNTADVWPDVASHYGLSGTISIGQQ